MLKYIKHHLDSILNIEIYPLISLLIFFIFFVGLLFYTFTMGKQKIDHLSNIPLNQDSHEE